MPVQTDSASSAAHSTAPAPLITGKARNRQVTATVALGSTWLTPRMGEFLEIYPDVDVAFGEACQQGRARHGSAHDHRSGPACDPEICQWCDRRVGSAERW